MPAPIPRIPCRPFRCSLLLGSLPAVAIPLVGGLVLAACQGFGQVSVDVAPSSAPKGGGAERFRIGGHAQGLAGTVTLASDALGSLAVRENGPFWMPQALSSGTAFEVVVAQVPSAQDCRLVGGQGTVEGQDSDAMQLSCQDSNLLTTPQDANLPAATFALTVVVTGLVSGSSVTVSEGATSIALGNGGHPFGALRAAGTAFHLTLQSPSGHTCHGDSLSGVMPGAPAAVSVSCQPIAYPLTFAATGLPAAAVVAVSDGTQTVQLTSAASSSAWPTSIAYGSTIAVQAADVTRFSRCRFATDTSSFSGQMPAGPLQVPLTCVPFLHLVSGQPAQQVFGQPDFVSSSSGSGAIGLGEQYGAAAVAHTGAIYLPDPDHGRVVGYHAWPNGNGVPFDFVVGAADLTAASDSTLPAYPLAVGVAGDHLAIAGVDGRAVQLFNSLVQASQAPQVTLGGDSSCSATGIGRLENMALTSAALLVLDRDYHRILIWKGIPTSDNKPADTAIGQPDLTTCALAGSMGASTLNSPQGVWSGFGLTAVADAGNNRVLLWRQAAEDLASGQPADVVLGAADMTSQGSGAATASSMKPSNVTSNGTQLFVTDGNNNRVLVWNQLPTVTNQPADVVLGQPGFTSASCNQGGSPDSNTLCAPTGITVTTNALLVADQQNHRTLVYRGQ